MLPHAAAPRDIDVAPSAADLAEARAVLAAAGRDPWLASLFMRGLDDVRRRLDGLRAWLASLPRRARRAFSRRWALAAPLAAVLLALGGRTAEAAMIPVGGGCTLSAAIVNANNDDQSGSASCAAGNLADTIVLTGGTYLLNANYGGPLPDISSPITIQANGATLDAEGAGFPVLYVDLGGDLTLDQATITGGGSIAGGIANYGTARIEDSTISGNFGAFGGGIANVGTLDLVNSTVSGNSAIIAGGILNGYPSVPRVATANIVDSTISGNTAVFGGGISNIGYLYMTGSTLAGNTAYEVGGGLFNGFLFGPYLGTAAIVNSTISGNSAEGGGGVFNYHGPVRLIQVTLTDNYAPYGGGIFNYDGPTTVTGSIVADQAAGDDCFGNLATLYSGGFNLESAATCGFTMTGDIQSGNADLGPLADNGGPTFTHALGPFSDALDSASNAICAAPPVGGVDQRGVIRPQPAGGTCDIGAFERQAQASPPTAAVVTGFAAAVDPSGGVRVSWETASEVDVVGFRVLRAVAGGAGGPGGPGEEGPREPVGGLIAARGSAAGGARYEVADHPGVGEYAYRLEVENAGGPPTRHGTASAVVRALAVFLPWAGG